jgi:hypothetical protein
VREKEERRVWRKTWTDLVLEAYRDISRVGLKNKYSQIDK